MIILIKIQISFVNRHERLEESMKDEGLNEEQVRSTLEFTIIIDIYY